MTQKETNEVPISWQSSAKKVINDIGSYLKQVTHTDLDKVFKEPENDEEMRKIAKIRKASLAEFILSLGLAFIAMWEFWWEGVVLNDPLLTDVGYGIIGVIGVWAIFISPFWHFHFEKGLTYRRGYLGLDYEPTPWTAFLEERGFGSLKQYWQTVLKERKGRRIANFMTFYVIFSVIMYLMFEFGTLTKIAKALGVSDSTMQNYSAITAITWTYQIFAVVLLIYASYSAGQWENTGDKDGIKKFLMVIFPALIAFLGIWFMWGFGISINPSGAWTASWASTATVYQMAFDNFWSLTNPMGMVVLAVLGIFVLFYFFMKYLALGIVIRFDNLKTAAFQWLYIAVITVILIAVLNGIFLIPAVNDYVAPHQLSAYSGTDFLVRIQYIFNGSAAQLTNQATLAGILSHWGEYVWWGFAQELLFLGYWCTLLTKIFKNKYIVSLLSGMCFAFIHFPSWPLMILTVIAGFFWGLAWQRNDARNLFVMGASHGFGGTLLFKFVPITGSVGPSNIV